MDFPEVRAAVTPQLEQQLARLIGQEHLRVDWA
jgi:hypothetical protein